MAESILRWIYCILCALFRASDYSPTARDELADFSRAQQDDGWMPSADPQHANQGAEKSKWEPSDETIRIYRHHIMKHQRKPVPWMAPGATIGKREPFIQRFRPNPAPLVQGSHWYVGNAWSCGRKFNASMVTPIVGIRHVGSRSRLVQKVGPDMLPLAKPAIPAPELLFPGPVPVVIVENCQSIYQQIDQFSAQPISYNPGYLAVPSPAVRHEQLQVSAVPVLPAILPEISSPMPVNEPASLTANVGPSEHDMPERVPVINDVAENDSMKSQPQQLELAVPDNAVGVSAPEPEISQLPPPAMSVETTGQSQISQPSSRIFPVISYPSMIGNAAAAARRRSEHARTTGHRPQQTSTEAKKPAEVPVNPLLRFAQGPKEERIGAHKMMAEWIVELIQAAKDDFPEPYFDVQLRQKNVHDFCADVYIKFKWMHDFITYGDLDEFWNEEMIEKQQVKGVGIRKGEYLTVLGKKLKEAAKKSPIGDVAEACKAFVEFDTQFEPMVQPSL